MEGHAVMVWKNLYEALRRLIRLHTHDRGLISRIPLLWVDSLCIDQGNVSERNHQVRLMSQIYSQASFVLVWLGEHADGSHNVITCARRMLGTKNRTRKEELTKLLSRPYWTRLWVVQEILLARSITLLCGWDYVDMSEFSKYIDAHLEDEDVHLAKPDVFIPAEARLGGVSSHQYYGLKKTEFGGYSQYTPVYSEQLWDEELEEKVPDIEQEQLKATPGLDLLRAKTWWHPKTARLHKSILRWAHRECEDPRDKVFALIGLIDNKDDPSYSAIKPDYGMSRERLYAQVIFTTLEAEETWFASGMGALVSLNERETFADDLARILEVNEYDDDVDRARKSWQSSMTEALQAGRYDSTRTFRPSGIEVWKSTYTSPKTAITASISTPEASRAEPTYTGHSIDDDFIVGDLEM